MHDIKFRGFLIVRQRKLYKNLLLSSLAMMILSCSKESNENLAIANEEQLITAEFPEESKASVTEGSSALNLSWQQDDYITIVSGSTRERYSLVSISGSKATFKGNPVTGSSYDIILSRAYDYLSRSYTGQRQKTVSSTDHLQYDAVLKGVKSYKAVTFTKEWAKNNGGELLQSGCLLLYFQMPEDAGKLKSVTLSAPSAIFYQSNSKDGGKSQSMTLEMADANMASNNHVKARLMTSMQAASIPANTQLTLTVVSNIGTWSKKFTPGASTINPGEQNVIKLNTENWTVPSGDGTQDNPYIIRTKADLFAMGSKMSSSATTYFAMVDNVDMGSEDWTVEIKNTTPIDFNGNDKKIDNFKCHTGSYRGFIRILNGRVSNLSITHANVNGIANNGTQPCGIVAGYCGNNKATAEGTIECCYVQGTVNGGSNGVGGLVGVIGHGTINKCGAAITVTNTHTYSTGGLVGCDNDSSENNKVSITNSWSTGLVSGGQERIGGIIGVLHREEQSSHIFVVSDCFSKAHVKGESNCGGIVGNAWKKQGCTKVERCIAWNEGVTATNCTGNVPSSGAIIGLSRNQQLLSDCYRKSDLNFTCKYLDLNYSVPLSDHNNVSSSSKLPYSGPSGGTSTHSYIYPYHGKAAGANETLSDVAKRLGWDEKVWNLSGDTPILIR